MVLVGVLSNMITIVAPTMWMFDQFIPFLYDLVEHPLVGEIIIVDNNENKRPEDKILYCNKVKVYSFGRNTFVNPVWNFGVEQASFNKVCVMNDDIIFDTRVFNRVYDHITPDKGITGLSVFPCKDHFVDGMIRITPYEMGTNTYGFGLLFFTHKKSYIPIPEGLDVYFGDNFLFDSCIWHNKPISIIRDIFYYTPCGSTCGQLGDIIQSKFFNEKNIYRDIIKSYGHDPKYWCPEHFSSE